MVVGAVAGEEVRYKPDMTTPVPPVSETRSNPGQRLRIGWIGIGVMGRSMAGHLLAAGHEITVFTRTPEKARELIERGAIAVADPREAAEGRDAVLSMVGYPEDVREVHLGTRGTLAAARPAPLLIDMTTSRPALAVEIAKAAAGRGIEALDAPVSGGDVGARNATLSIMVGGSDEAFRRAGPIFASLGKTVVRQGGPGAGQHCKMVNQILIAGTMLGSCEGLVYAKAVGLDPATVLESVSGGAAGSWTVSNLLPRVLRGDFNPGFFVEHFLKDLQIALEEAESVGLGLEATALARRLYEHAVAGGRGRLGTQSLALVLEERWRRGLPVG